MDFLYNKKYKNILKYQVCETQRNKKWHSERLKMITASDVYDIMDKRNRTKSYEKLFKIKTGQILPFSGNEYTKWGIKSEREAIEYYSKETGYKIEKCGLIQHSIHNFIGGSPDGIVIDNNDDVILLEIKSSNKIHHKHNIPPKHYAQIQLLMEICDIETCHYVQYKPNNNFEKLNIIIVARNKDWFNNTLPRLIDFWKEVDIHKQSKSLNTNIEYKNELQVSNNNINLKPMYNINDINKNEYIINLLEICLSLNINRL